MRISDWSLDVCSSDLLFAEKMDSYLKLAWYQQQPLSVEVRRPNGTDPTFWFGDYEGILVREDTRYGDAILYIDHALARLQAGINLEVAIERYNPESKSLFIGLTERQVATLTEGWEEQPSEIKSLLRNWY